MIAGQGQRKTLTGARLVGALRQERVGLLQTDGSGTEWSWLLT